jgi:hypothetical protein
MTPRYTVSPCDEQNEAGQHVRTWDVLRTARGSDSVCVSSGHRTRAEARAEARRLAASAVAAANGGAP